MSEKYYIGKKTANLTKSPELLPFSKVVIIVGDDEESGEQVIYEAGDDSGRTLELTNPWGTQQIADDMLARIRGYVYKPFEVRDSLLSDDADLGDAVTVGDVYSVIVNRDLTFDGLSASTVSAPNADETDNEFGNYRSAADRMLARRFNGITTRFVVERGRIETLIDNVETGLSSRIEQTEASITMEINRAEGAEQALTTQLSILDGEIATKITSGEAQSLISSTISSITLSVSSDNNGSYISLTSNGVTISSDTVDLRVRAANVSGELTAATISADRITGGTIIANYLSGLQGKLSLLTESGVEAGYFGAYSVHNSVVGTRTYTTMAKSDSFYVGLTDYGGHDDIVMLADNAAIYADLYLGRKLLLSSSSYGYSKPSDSSGRAGQVFFLLQ